MPFDSVSAVIGALAWEAAKLVLSTIFRRIGHKSVGKRKALAELTAQGREQVTTCLGRTLEYLTSDLSVQQRTELARVIKHDIQVLAQSVKTLNEYALDLKLQPISNFSISQLRRAFTWHLDENGFIPKKHDSASVANAYHANELFQAELTRLHITSC
ncbi:hypothetical protein [Hylemonella gracilis]|uniref:hypothetical protein n=1 Tax=Hylemonella gracilis TaxID=80880 RepID=UPI0012DF307F|nr:hypothetical protein [Hylemonella gracilis]